MTEMTLYTGAGVSLSPVYEEGRTDSGYRRLVAGTGKALQKGQTIAPCIDVPVSDVENWEEIDDPFKEELDDSEAIEILLGGAS